MILMILIIKYCYYFNLNIQFIIIFLIKKNANEQIFATSIFGKSWSKMKTLCKKNKDVIN